MLSKLQHCTPGSASATLLSICLLFSQGTQAKATTILDHDQALSEAISHQLKGCKIDHELKGSPSICPTDAYGIEYLDGETTFYMDGFPIEVEYGTDGNAFLYGNPVPVYLQDANSCYSANNLVGSPKICDGIAYGIMHNNLEMGFYIDGMEINTKEITDADGNSYVYGGVAYFSGKIIDIFKEEPICWEDSGLLGKPTLCIGDFYKVDGKYVFNDGKGELLVPLTNSDGSPYSGTGKPFLLGQELIILPRHWDSKSNTFKNYQSQPVDNTPQ